MATRPPNAMELQQCTHAVIGHLRSLNGPSGGMKILIIGGFALHHYLQTRETVAPHLASSAKPVSSLTSPPIANKRGLLISKLQSAYERQDVQKATRDAEDAASLVKMLTPNGLPLPLLVSEKLIARRAIESLVDFTMESQQWWEVRLGLAAPGGHGGNQQGHGGNQQGQSGNQQGQGYQQGQGGYQQGHSGYQQGHGGHQQGQSGKKQGKSGKQKGQGGYQQAPQGGYGYQQGQGGGYGGYPQQGPGGGYHGH